MIKQEMQSESLSPQYRRYTSERNKQKTLAMRAIMTTLILCGIVIPVQATITDDSTTQNIIVTVSGGSATATGTGNVVVGNGVSAGGNNGVVIGKGSTIASVANMTEHGIYAIMNGVPALVDENNHAYVFSSDGTKLFVDKKGIPLTDQSDTSKYVTVTAKQTMSKPTDAVAIGTNTSATGNQAIAMGTGAIAYEQQSLALGAATKANKFNATAIGNNTIADGYGAIGIGGDDVGTKNQLFNSVKGGNSAYADMVYDPSQKEIVHNPYVLATDRTQKSYYENGQLVKETSKASYYRLQRWNALTSSFEDIPEGDPSMPESYRWVAVSNDGNATDANGNASWDVMGISDYYKSQGLTGTDLTKAVSDFYSPYQESESTGVASIALGIKTQAKTDGSIAAGMGAVAAGDESMSLGVGTVTTGNRSIGMGSLASASGNRSIAIGTYEDELRDSDTRYSGPHATADDAIAIGTSAYSDYPKGIALGADSITSADAGYLRASYDPNTGIFTYGTTTSAGAIGNVDSATVNGITYDGFAASKGHGLLSIGAADHERRLQNLAAGEISETSTDAVNGSQLYSALKNSGWNLHTTASEGTVTGSSKEFINNGESVTVDAGKNIAIHQAGNIVSIATKDNVEFSNITSRDNAGNITTINGGGITITGNGNHPVSITNNGLDNGGNRITNVAPGIESTDAVSVSQLNNEVSKLSSDINHVGARAAALTSLKTIQYDPLEPTQISAGVGQYGNASAMAIGISHYKNESTLFSGGIAFGGGGNGKIMANASITWKFGHRSHEPAVRDTYRNGPISSTYALQDQVSALLNENSAQKAALINQQKEIDAQRQKINELETKLASIMNRLEK